MDTIRIVIADDQALIREGLKTVLNLEPGLQVAATAGSGEEACSMAEMYRPDVMLLDIRMPGMDGITCVTRILAASPATRVLMLTTFHEDAYVIGALANGACGFLLKDIQIPSLTEAIRDAAAGKIVLPPDVAATLTSYLSRKKAEETMEPSGQFTALTGREYEAALMLSQGFTNRQIASALYLSEGTVRNMVSAIYAKIGIGDRAQAALYLREHMR